MSPKKTTVSPTTEAPRETKPKSQVTATTIQVGVADDVQTANETSPAVVLFKSPVPFYGTILIGIGTGVLLLCCLVWCCKYLTDKKPKSSKRTVGGLSAIPDLTKEALQPGIDDLDNIDSKALKSPEFVGKLHYSIEYSIGSSTLSVTVIEARDLAAMDVNGKSDPYVKVRLQPKKKPVFCTKIVKTNRNPLFNETFSFEVHSTEIATRTLTFHVFDYDAVGKDDLIGSVTIPLSTLNLSAMVEDWKDLIKARGSDSEKTLGDVCISLRYVSANSLLTVVVLEAKNLPRTDAGEEPDSYVKLTLKLDGKRLKKKKTTIRKASSNPYFNETLIFDVEFKHMKTLALEVTVATPGVFRSKRIGSVDLGFNVPNAPQALHWKDMFANMRHPIARWHQLQLQTEQETEQ